MSSVPGWSAPAAKRRGRTIVIGPWVDARAPGRSPPAPVARSADRRRAPRPPTLASARGRRRWHRPAASRYRCLKRESDGPERHDGRRAMTPSLIERLAAVPEVWTEPHGWALSPDGATLAFTWRREGDWHVYVKELRGAAAPRRVEPFDDACACPVFSPDGAYLYFARDDRGSECFDIYRCELATGDALQSAARHADAGAGARLRPVARRPASRPFRQPRAKLGGGRHGGRRRRREPHPADRSLVQRLVAALLARRRPSGLPERHPRAGLGRLHHRGGRRRAARDRRRDRAAGARPGLVARRPLAGLRRRRRRLRGHRPLRSRAQPRDLGLGGRGQRPRPELVARRPRPGLLRRRGARELALAPRPDERPGRLSRHRSGQPLPARLHHRRRRRSSAR